MNDVNNKLTGLNMWFVIEIMSFYGYVVSAMWFIFESQIRSSYGWLNKEYMKDRYKYDFISYHRLDIDWLAFVTILCLVNMGIMIISYKLHPEQHTVTEF